jgi:formylglycine-generating enzyme required for sulfatase activity/tRNA A-37 threonylcarbamoyl transferase component Bud32
VAELTGQTFAGFEVVAKLGQGGMGAVYKARQPLLDRFVALKVMSQQLSGDAGYVARFIREAASAAKLSHPNMVQVYSAGEQGGVYYIVMEFVEGESLHDRLLHTGHLDPIQAIAITLYVAQALQVAWNKAHLIHRDIKPDNIFLSKDGEVKVGDLGLAKSVTEGATEMTQSGVMMGSPHYMSPEQARASKETDFRTDIYSLGCTLYQLLTGTTPYQADDVVGLILKHVTEPTPDLQAILPSCPPALVALVGKMMAKDRNQRHASYEELVAELWQVSDVVQQALSAATAVMTPIPAEAAATSTPTVAKVGTLMPTVVRDSKPVIRDSRLVIGGAVAAAVLLLAGVFLWSPWKNRTDEQGRREGAKLGSESRLQAESVSGQPAKAGTPNAVASASAALKLLGSVYTNSVGAEMVYIPPGEFMMGSTKEEQAWAVAYGRKVEEVKCEGEAPRKATIKQAFWMGRTEVTVGQWKQFVKETSYVTDGEKKGESSVPQQAGKPSTTKKGVSWRNPDFGFEMRDDHPVSYISWDEAMAFCKWLTERERKAGRLVPGCVVRLPTEAEWEYACRAGTRTRSWWGDSKENGKGRLNWSEKDDGFEFVAPVDSFGARGRNRFGLADMLGNVYEWCLDDYDATQAHEECYQGNPGERVVRGASFLYSPSRCRSAHRRSLPPSISNRDFGFRVCVGVDLSNTETPTPSTSPVTTPKEGGILAPTETRVAALTTTPKVGEVFTLPLGSNVTMELMGIPPGEFMLGSTKEEQAWAITNGAQEKLVKCEGEVPRKATIKQGFWLGRTEVTVGQWKQFAKETGYVTDGEKKGESFVPAGVGKPWVPKRGVSWRNPDFGFEIQDNHPVSCISWNDARAFCEWLTERERQAGRLAQSCAVRLPTEAEWEYACRAGTQTKFWWGESREDGKGRLNWSGKEDGFEFVAPGSSYGVRGRNRFGLADMLGNVWEWCLDEHDATHAHEDLWTGNPGARVLRGGAFHYGPPHCRCANRHCYHPSTSFSSLGFRVTVGMDVSGARTSRPSTSSAVAPKESGILAPAETRVATLTTTPNVGEVFTLPLGSNVTMELMGIPPGEFMLGSTKEERTWAVSNGAKEEKVKNEGEAPRKTTIKQGFWMSRTEITSGQWKHFVKETGYITDGEKKGGAYVYQGPGKLFAQMRNKGWRDPNFGSEPKDNHPVCCLSWNDTVAFCLWLTECGRKARQLPYNCVVRLPTEAEWEYACRSGSQSKFWWGESREDGRGRSNFLGKEDGFEETAPVDSFGARGRNRFGLVDMLGNLWEWCLDEYDVTQAHEDLWKGNADYRVLRGGSFMLGHHYNRCASRREDYPSGSSSQSGFRVAVGPAR